MTNRKKTCLLPNSSCSAIYRHPTKHRAYSARVSLSRKSAIHVTDFTIRTGSSMQLQIRWQRCIFTHTNSPSFCNGFSCHKHMNNTLPEFDHLQDIREERRSKRIQRQVLSKDTPTFNPQHAASTHPRRTCPKGGVNDTRFPVSLLTTELVYLMALPNC